MTDNQGTVFTPDLSYVIQTQVYDIINNIHTAIPARVVAYNHTAQSISAQPLVWDWDYAENSSDRHVITPPVLTNVPLVFPGGGGYRITFPVELGDQVLLIFSERSIREWKINGGGHMPEALVRHGINTAIAIGALKPPGAAALKGNDGNGTSTSNMTMGYDTGPQYMASKTTLRLGHANATQAVIKGTSFSSGLSTLLDALSVFGLANTLTGGTAISDAALAFQTLLSSYLSTNVLVD